MKFLSMIRQTWLRTAALGGLILATTGCAQFAAVSESMFLMSPAQEQQLGQQFGTELSSKMTMVQDPELLAYVRQVGKRVVQAAPRSELPITFHIVKDKEINAFAIPGGNIYLNTGFIAAADDEAELAGVMAHEAGHVIMRHSARQVSQQQGAQLIQQIVLGTDVGKGQLAQMASAVVAQGAIARYSREDESESDAIAVKTLYRAGYDPNGMYTFFTKLEKRYGSGGGGLATIFASHPATQDRKTNVRRLVAQLPPGGGAERPTKGLKQAQARLKTLGYE